MIELLVASWFLTASLMLIAWLIQRAQQNAAIVDVTWCLSFALSAIGLAVLTTGEPTRRGLVAVMAAMWEIRLAGHVLVDRVLDRAEDARYQTIRRRWGARAHAFFFVLFQIEALAVPMFLLPLLVLMENPRATFSIWEWVGMVVWITAMIGEWLADRQLARYRNNPGNRGKTCREGLWRYSRHPNYFFESLHWWAYVFMGIGVPYGWVTLVGPLLMTMSLWKVTGIPLAEAQAVKARGEDYRQYQRTTSAFIPWFSKEGEGHEARGNRGEPTNGEC